MSIKNVVKVMNFHALLRVDSAKRNAEKYFLLENELSKFIDNIINNRNFLLDKNIMLPDADSPALNIYIGSDFGFCSNYNSQVNSQLREDWASERKTEKVLIGKKILYSGDDVLFRTTKEKLVEDMEQLTSLLEDSVRNKRHCEIAIIYNRYIDASTIKMERKKIFPMKLEDKDSSDYIDDFTFEDDINEILIGLIAHYVIYEMRISLVNANASENVLRQNTTRESMKKIDEREEIFDRKYIKEKRAKEFRKIIENHVKKPVM